MLTVTIHSTAREYPSLPYETIAKAVLGDSYTLSLTFLGATRAKALNKATRGKTYVPNVLSFPLTRTCGEIYVTPVVARKEAADFGLSYRGYVGFLFIHGLLHLKGLDHGPKMEALEKTYMQRFKLR